MASSEDRDEMLVLNINDWISSNHIVLPPDMDDFSHWDIYETLHDEKYSIVEIGSTIYEHTTKNEKDKTAEFLEDSDDEYSEDDDIRSIKMEQLRIVFDFDTDSKPQVLAIYRKKNGKFEQIFSVKEFVDSEIHSLCVSNEDGLNNEDSEDCDLSILFKSLSKNQLVEGIKSFMSKHRKDKKLKQLAIKESDLVGLRLRDKEFLQIIMAQIVGIDEGVLLEMNAKIDDDLNDLTASFKQSMTDLEGDIFDESQLDVVLNLMEEIVLKALSLRQLHQNQIALDLVLSTLERFLIEFLCKMDENDLEDMGIEKNAKLNYRVCDLENAMEKICKSMHLKECKETLIELRMKLKKWQELILEKMPFFGPLFSDNIRSLNKKLDSAKKRKLSQIGGQVDDDANSVKKRKIK